MAVRKRSETARFIVSAVTTAFVFRFILCPDIVNFREREEEETMLM